MTERGAWERARGEELDYCLDKLRGVHDREPAAGPPQRPHAMQLALHLPKAAEQRPTRSALLAAAARACAQLCLDARIAPGGPWHEAYALWIDSQMRKVARRARGSHWEACGRLDTITAGEPATSDGAEPAAVARAFVPGPVDAVDPLVARLQVGGTDLPADDPAPAPPGSLYLVVDDSLEMSAGKAAAQVCHAVMLLLAELDRDRVERWLDDGLPLAVRYRDAGPWERLAAAADAGDPGVAGVRDAGYTEVAPGSLTAIGLDPQTAEADLVAVVGD